MTRPFRLYGVAISLYTGRVRAYLRKQHIDYRETSPGSEHFIKNILPQIKRFIIPVLETPTGEIVQDGVDIIDWFEQQGLARLPAYPTTPCQRLVAHAMELFGAEGLLRPAMHYRWNFPETNDGFLTEEFGRIISREAAPASMDRMRQAAVMLGVTPSTIPAIEAFYTEFLDVLNAHFEAHPYLLGGRPSLGDYALYAAMKPHLGRDPYPAVLMMQRASMVYRWTERMAAPDPDMGEFRGYPEDWVAADGIPETLKPVLRMVAADYLPELDAQVAFANTWLEDHPDVRDGAPVGNEPGQRAIGSCRFSWRGTEIESGVLPYRFYVLQRLQDAYDTLDATSQTAARALFDAVGLTPLLDSRVDRRVERTDHVEVWGESTR